jgi:hypothetical protein
LCFGFLAVLPLTVQAKQIEVTFDAGKYRNAEDWRNFVANLCETLRQAPNYENGDTFNLKVQNGDIFRRKPDVDYLDKKEPQQTKLTEMLSKIQSIEVDTKDTTDFSTSSLVRVFSWTETLKLPNTEYISGFSEKTSLSIGPGEYNSVVYGPKTVPSLIRVLAPKVIGIANGAFFNFQNLQCFNDHLPVDTEHPAIVCTTLNDEVYFKQERAPEDALISPTPIRKVNTRYKNIIGKYVGRSVTIGACAFQKCYGLQHVSARVSYVGSDAFSASGVKSVHLLLSKQSTEDPAELGDDVFFNCFRLREFFAVQEYEEPRFVNSSLNGFFWNCFALQAVCMPNICPKAKKEIRKYNDPAAYSLFCKGAENPFTLFTNCFSLKVVDVRAFQQSNIRIFPYWLVRIDPKSITQKLCSKDREKDRGDWESYLSSVFAMRVKPEDMKVAIASYPENIRKYINLCFGETKDDKLMELFQCEIGENLLESKKDIYKRPYCDIDCLYGGNRDNLNNPPFIVSDKVDPFDREYYPVERKFYSFVPDMFDNVLERFNDAYVRWWFVQEKPQNEIIGRKTNPFEEEEEEIVPLGKEKKGKPQNKIIGRKTNPFEEEEKEIVSLGKEKKGKPQNKIIGRKTNPFEEEEEEIVPLGKEKKSERKLSGRKTKRTNCQ